MTLTHTYIIWTYIHIYDIKTHMYISSLVNPIEIVVLADASVM